MAQLTTDHRRHCEELATKQSHATKNRLPRCARNDDSQTQTAPIFLIE
ncbi:MAG: hypothetical protein ACK5IQ_06155 [Bacteroidales bacterium]